LKHGRLIPNIVDKKLSSIFANTIGAVAEGQGEGNPLNFGLSKNLVPIEKFLSKNANLGLNPQFWGHLGAKLKR